MKILVTGASGFVGGHVVTALLAEHEVLGLARSDASAAVVRELGAEPLAGSLGAVDPEDLRGVHAIVHSAALVDDWGPHEAYVQANVEGTRQLLAAAQAAGVRHFVHIGTEAACFVGEDLVDIDETAPLRPDSPYSYSATKARAEQLVLAADRPLFRTVSLRPRIVWGPKDRTVLPTVLRILDDGGFWWTDGGRALTSTCHIDNLVAAVLTALDRPDVGGEAFFIADEGTITHRAFLTALVATAGRELPGRSMPCWLLRGVASLLAWTWRRLGRVAAPPVTPIAAGMLSRTITVRTDRARERLGWRPVVDRDTGLAALRSQSSPG